MAKSVQRKKMLWYYDAIIDWMIANPGKPLYECAAHVGRSPTTLSIIINSDMFKAALAARKSQFQVQHDFGLIQKTTQIAHAGLDAILETLDKKRSAVPIEQLQEVTGSALDRLGYGTKPQSGPSGGGVTINATGNTQVILPVTPAELEEARMAIRQVQQARADVGPVSQPSLPAPDEPSEAGSVNQGEEDVVASVIPTP